MNRLNGWLKLHRCVFDNPTVTKSADHLAVWLYLLCHATPMPYKALFGGKEITLSPGQLITGRKIIARCVNSEISESKVERILKCFENAHQIEQQSSNKNRLITLCNWQKYQCTEQQSEQQSDNSRTSTEQQANTYREKKEKREYKEFRRYSDGKKKKPGSSIYSLENATFDVSLLDQQTLFDD